MFYKKLTFYNNKLYTFSKLIKKRFIRSNYFNNFYRELMVGGNK